MLIYSLMEFAPGWSPSPPAAAAGTFVVEGPETPSIALSRGPSSVSSAAVVLDDIFSIDVPLSWVISMSAGLIGALPEPNYPISKGSEPNGNPNLFLSLMLHLS